MASSLVGGVGEDARHITGRIAAHHPTPHGKRWACRPMAPSMPVELRDQSEGQ
jgi:hypothetical protein